MMDESRATLLIRIAGFSLFWTWLFLMAVSPSPIFGQLMGAANTPFEISEETFRVLLLFLALAFAKRLATEDGRVLLSGICILIGPFSAISLALAQTPEMITAASFIVAVVDVSMLVMWLCYFGYAKLGDTAILIAGSYGFGSLFYMVVTLLSPAMMLGIAAALPVVSGIAFVASTKLLVDREGRNLFQTTEQCEHKKTPLSIKRMTGALVLYAFIFAFYSSRTASSEFAFASGPSLQAACSIGLGIVFLAIARFSKQKGLYAAYKCVPLLFAAGLCLFALAPSSLPTLAGALIIVAYLLFEILSFNDYCNAVKTNDDLLMRSMVMVRLAASSGMLLGWVAEEAIGRFGGAIPSPALIATTCLAVVVVASAIIFTDRPMSELESIAGNRAIQEKTEHRPDKMSFIPAFAEEFKLSKRETEVLTYLLSGRTMQYVAEKLFIAESTARTHTHKIYLKTNSGDRMQLIDSFERFCDKKKNGSPV